MYSGGSIRSGPLSVTTVNGPANLELVSSHVFKASGSFETHLLEAIFNKSLCIRSILGDSTITRPHGFWLIDRREIRLLVRGRKEQPSAEEQNGYSNPQGLLGCAHELLSQTAHPSFGGRHLGRLAKTWSGGAAELCIMYAACFQASKSGSACAGALL